jgi:hypothetical protein
MDCTTLGEVNRLRQSGLGILSACKQVGISDKSYRKWSTAEPAKVAMRPVALTVAISGVSSLTLVSPGATAWKAWGLKAPPPCCER